MRLVINPPIYNSWLFLELGRLFFYLAQRTPYNGHKIVQATTFYTVGTRSVSGRPTLCGQLGNETTTFFSADLIDVILACRDVFINLACSRTPARVVPVISNQRSDPSITFIHYSHSNRIRRLVNLSQDSLWEFRLQ